MNWSQLLWELARKGNLIPRGIQFPRLATISDNSFELDRVLSQDPTRFPQRRLGRQSTRNVRELP